MTGNIDAVTRSQSGAGYPASQQVSWYETYIYASNIAAQQGVSLDSVLPIAGTAQWCGLSDDDARKLLALILGGVREALNHDVEQERRADAAREIRCAGQWSALAGRIRSGRGGAYIPRKAS
ncbi:hypothetical protein BST36_16860 [Mycolicibacterium moriokaense]|uniref:DUF2742 domain-containing protein n=1 Tax=Mycolicibacterium moriokaense TaxID=39691 RepID=A0AAD1H7Q1_9MYCO|nr:DUF2742 domain-containing protein [Mycolicibacterium moriokaense]MCV7040913.1 DUF2742 domain-containing protein [Mycolicibacterium moriokaense]ORB21592.1 hypothetical protein BST36_16860 [Mycolicibacterium moriokaense]BBX00472.1 hypothetical protein MMOR_14080 [Mycolicibacterium moriokaense]